MNTSYTVVVQLSHEYIQINAIERSAQITSGHLGTAPTLKNREHLGNQALQGIRDRHLISKTKLALRKNNFRIQNLHT